MLQILQENESIGFMILILPPVMRREMDGLQ